MPASAVGEGRVWGTGGGSTVALLLKPSERAERCGGGTTALFACVVDVGRPGSAGLSGERSEALAVDCLGGSDGREGRARQWLASGGRQWVSKWWQQTGITHMAHMV